MTGLYNPREEHDSCGLAFVATLKQQASREIVLRGLEALKNMEHRGAVGAEENSGDGAGILVSTPDLFLRKAFAKEGIDLPEVGRYALGIAFFAQDESVRERQREVAESIAKDEGLKILGWRKVPVNTENIGPTALKAMPHFEQLAIMDDADYNNQRQGLELDRLAYRLRKRVQNAENLYFASLSARTITYKGMLTTAQLPEFWLDLQDDDFQAKISLVHSRFSTNTFPAWEFAQPLRNIAHNGEINTIRGNRNWLKARQGTLATDLLNGKNGGNIKDLLPILTEGFSDSGSFDEALELLHLSGRTLPHAALMMIPEAHENWDKANLTDEQRKLKAFYDYTNTLIEPWDGPASLSFTDGDIVGSVLDRNGLRPGRFWVTDEFVVMASEVGVLDIDRTKITRKGRLEPGKMLLVDTNLGKIIENDDIKAELAEKYPYENWVNDNSVTISELPHREHIMYPAASVELRQKTFGYTEEELKMVLTPMANTGKEPLGAMGTDTPLAVLSSRSRLLFDYFTQDFAQVTNPPLDSIREKIVTSITSAIGPEPNLLEDAPNHAKKLTLPFPVIDNDELAKIQRIEKDPKVGKAFKGVTIQGLFNAQDDDQNTVLESRLEEIFAEVDAAIENGCNFIILSDRDSTAEKAPIPSLLLMSAVQHHLLRNQTRTQVSVVVEAGDVRETHHVALLIGYGAAAVNPYLAMETVERLAVDGLLETDAKKATTNLIKALGDGVLKIMSKMGISTIMSYRGSQIFGAVGLSKTLIDKYFTGTTSKLGGVGLEELTKETLIRHRIAYPLTPTARPHAKLATGGEYKWRKSGEQHLFDPESIFWLQHSTEKNDYTEFKKYSSRIDENTARQMTLRSVLAISGVDTDLNGSTRPPIPLSEVEPVEAILKRFSTGAMSYGSISKEAHETLAIAMNSIGARSNSGEGGEDIDRIYDSQRRSRIKQVASGRFGVTSEYLVSADDLQIKLAQGAKPGEGGHLPGGKVYPWVAATRHSTPGIDLVSPPPHHDIYSIEDLAELIHDLKMANPEARVHVKLVAEYGVGTIAAGVAKAHADVILISGHDGGTGAAPLSSIKHAGGAWEVGLAEAQQVLVANNLRDRVVLQTDGQLKTGRDVIIAALLGAEEFGFATAPLVVEGCVMMRVCNKNTCPVGVATQDPELRQNFKGKPENVVNYFKFIAEEVREHLAKLGFRTFEEAIGHVELLSEREGIANYKASALDLQELLAKPTNTLNSSAPLVKTREQNHGLDLSLDAKLMSQIDFDNLDTKKQVITSKITNVDRTFGTLISYDITKRYNSETGRTLHDDALYFELNGVAGQSFGAFLPRGVTCRLVGEANDYVAKGLSGGKVIVNAEDTRAFDPHTAIIAGNVLGFGATSGVGYFAGVVGERFAVRNSGATFVAEGAGDHALEYMTGGKVMILGNTGKNLGAGFLGGVGYVLDLDYRKLNADAVANDLLSLTPISDLSSEIQADAKALLEDYSNATNSSWAKALLADWPQTSTRLTRIIPRKYEAISRIADPSNNWNEVLAVAGG